MSASEIRKDGMGRTDGPNFPEGEQRNFIDLGVAFSVPDYVAQESLRLSQEIGKVAPLTYSLDKNERVHITVFQGRFPLSNQTRLIKELEFIRDSKAPHIEMTDSFFFRPNGNVFWNTETNWHLKSLHLMIQAAAHPKLTKGMIMDQFVQRLNNPATEEWERRNINEYGVGLAGERYLPHITLCALKNPEDKRLVDFHPHLAGFTVESIIVGELGSRGNVRTDKILEEIRFSSK